MQTSVELLMGNLSYHENYIANMETENVTTCNMFNLCRMVASMSAHPEIITGNTRLVLKFA